MTGVRWMAHIGTVERDASGRALRFRGISLDVTERRHGEELMRKNVERSEEIAHIGHWTWRLRDNRAWWSRELYRIFGFTPDCPPTIDALARAVHPDDRARVIAFGRILLANAVPDDVIECRIVAADGVTRHILSTIGGCLRDDDGTITQISGVVHDVTARKSAEAEVLRIGEEERRRVAADLHDGVLQELTGIALLTASVRRELESGREAPAERLQRIERAIVQAIDHTRQIASAVDPLFPGASGLVGALRSLTRAVEETHGVRCTLQESSTKGCVDDPVVAQQVYRIAQEAVRNAVRHARAVHVRIGLDADGDGIRLSIVDDGRGLAAERFGAGLGFNVMRYRAGLIGGSLTIGPGKDGGTVVMCRFTPSQS